MFTNKKKCNEYNSLLIFHLPRASKTLLYTTLSSQSTLLNCKTAQNKHSSSVWLENSCQDRNYDQEKTR